MKIIRDIQKIDFVYKNAVVALGNFDGLHLGHRSIITHATEVAKSENRPLAIMTFEPHPREFFANRLANKKQQALRIYNLRSKLETIKSLGVNIVFLARFNDKFSGLGAHEFIEKILLNSVQAKYIVTGKDFRFGKNKSGDANLLAEYAEKYGFGYTAYNQVESSGEAISSSLIRGCLENGNVVKAGKLLEQPYHISGKVQRGEQRGTKIGFPTANISLKKLFLPKFGVYAVRAMVDGKSYNAVANLGVKPTFGEYSPNLEVHLFDTNQDLYGKRICVEFIDFIRDEQKFASLEELKSQIEKDLVEARIVLSAEKRG